MGRPHRAESASAWVLPPLPFLVKGFGWEGRPGLGGGPTPFAALGTWPASHVAGDAAHPQGVLCQLCFCTTLGRRPQWLCQGGRGNKKQIKNIKKTNNNEKLLRQTMRKQTRKSRTDNNNQETDKKEQIKQTRKNHENNQEKIKTHNNNKIKTNWTFT